VKPRGEEEKASYRFGRTGGGDLFVGEEKKKPRRGEKSAISGAALREGKQGSGRSGVIMCSQVGPKIKKRTGKEKGDRVPSLLSSALLLGGNGSDLFCRVERERRDKTRKREKGKR